MSEALDERSERAAATLDPQTADLARRHVLELRKLGLVFKITSAKRTQAEQDALYAKGRTAPGPVVTWTRNSRHLSGRAYDLTQFSADGRTPIWDAPGYTTAGKVGESLGLVWGGRWKSSPDMPHFERPV